MIFENFNILMFFIWVVGSIFWWDGVEGKGLFKTVGHHGWPTTKKKKKKNTD